MESFISGGKGLCCAALNSAFAASVSRSETEEMRPLSPSGSKIAGKEQQAHDPPVVYSKRDLETTHSSP